MTPYYSDSWLTVYQGDCREVMAAMEPASVHCVVTSPPYWGLRDYGTATWIGGDPECDHSVGDQVNQTKDRGTLRETAIAAGQRPGVDASRCRRCGAVREDGQLGLEATPEAYVAAMVEVFRAVRRVLRDDGTVWLNLGDSYATHPNGNAKPRADQGEGWGAMHPYTEQHQGVRRMERTKENIPGLKPKDLVGIPWRVAFALQADGWYLRSDIIWAKPNPMPESVTDRPTKAHEYLFLLSKSPRYYFDADAVREPLLPATVDREAQGYRHAFASQFRGSPTDERHPDGKEVGSISPSAGRNIRSVWTIATARYPGAHFATFPPKLVEPCVKAGCPPDGNVLDPFAGSGTTGMVAQSLGRRAVLIDLNGDYLVQAMARNADIPLGLEIA